MFTFKKRMRVIVGMLFLVAFASAYGANADNPGRTQKMDIRFVVFHKPGPKWISGVDFQKQPGVMDHVLHYKKYDEDGRLELGGPYLDGTGGMMVPVAGETKESIQKFASEDPAVKQGLLIFEVKPWLIAMKRMSTKAE